MPRFLVIIALALTAASAPALAAPPAGPASRAVKQASDKMSRLLQRQVAADSAEEKRLAKQVTSELRDFLDVDELGRLALKDHWKELDQSARAEYLRMLRTLIEANYIKGLRANLKYQVRYTGEEKRGDKKVVNTEIVTRRRGRPTTIEIDYLVRNVEGNWRAIDVITDGVGLVENYRAQFNRIIAKEGMDGLLARMRKKLKALERG